MLAGTRFDNSNFCCKAPATPPVMGAPAHAMEALAHAIGGTRTRHGAHAMQPNHAPKNGVTHAELSQSVAATRCHGANIAIAFWSNIGANATSKKCAAHNHDQLTKTSVRDRRARYFLLPNIRKRPDEAKPSSIVLKHYWSTIFCHVVLQKKERKRRIRRTNKRKRKRETARGEQKHQTLEETHERMVT